MKILIAEDDTAIMTAYKLVLKPRNHEVFAAIDGEQCLTMFRDHVDRTMKEGRRGRAEDRRSSSTPFDLVILDYRMPKKDGLEVAENILSMVPNQRIIIASAYTHEIPISKIPDKSYVDMLQKPFEFDIFLDLVEGGQTGPAGKNSKKPSSDLPASLADSNSDNGLDDQFTKMGYISEIFWQDPEVKR